MIVIKNAGLRKLLKKILPFFIMPLVIAIGVSAFNTTKYAYISLAMTILALILFICGFEKKKTGTRRFILTAVITALSVTGRFIPLFKPITSMTIIAAVYLGGEAGFLVGALSAVISNFYFGQGPWTPFQMFAWGMIGLIAGFFAEKLKRRKLLLIIYGIISGIIYSLLMDIWTVIWYNKTFNGSYYLAAVISAIPYTIIYIVSNIIFLAALSKPIGDKLERVKKKYDI